MANFDNFTDSGFEPTLPRHKPLTSTIRPSRRRANSQRLQISFQYSHQFVVIFAQGPDGRTGEYQLFDGGGQLRL